MGRWARLVGAAMAFACLAFACTGLTGLGDLTRVDDAVDCTTPGVDCVGDASADGSAGNDTGSNGDGNISQDAGDASLPPSGCVSPRGPLMITVSAGGKSFCIDSTEVTEKQYADFVLAKAGNLNGQPATCAWNNSYEPHPGCDIPDYDPVARPNLPVGGVDWCDAYAFCAWAGKRLCGRIGGGPTTNDPEGAGGSALTNGSVSEWFAACSNGDDGAHAYPYGSSYNPVACNGDAFDAGQTVPVGSLAQCKGGVPKLSDMSGNLAEWENACGPGPDGGLTSTARCVDRGGAYYDDPGSLRCDAIDTSFRDHADSDCVLGIRCCADP